MSRYPETFNHSFEFPRAAETPAAEHELDRPLFEELPVREAGPEALLVAAPPVAQPAASNAQQNGTLSTGSLVSLAVSLTALFLIVGAALCTLSPSSTPSKPVVQDLLLDNEDNVRYLTVNIKGKPYVCNPNMNSFGEVLMHCDPAGAPK